MEDVILGALIIFGFFGIIIIFGVVYTNSNEKEKKKRKDALGTKISKLPNKDNLKIVIGTTNQYAFVLDNVGKLIYYMDIVHTQKVTFDKIISVEVLEDSTVVSSKSSTRTVGGALVGGAIAGGAGMVVGGLSGNTKQKKEVSKLTIKIKIRDYSTPSLTITCFDVNNGYYGQIYNVELQNAQKIADYVSVIIDETDRKERQAQNAIQETPKTSSVADELTKLAALKEQGILTDEEFRIQKEKLLKK